MGAVQLLGGGVYAVLGNEFTFASTTGVQGVLQGSPTICFSSQELGLGFVKIVHFQDNSRTFGVLSSVHFSFNEFLIKRTRYICLNVGKLQRSPFYS